MMSTFRPYLIFALYFCACAFLTYISYAAFWEGETPGLIDWKKDEYLFSVLFYSLRNEGTLPAFLPPLPFLLKYPSLVRSPLYFPNPEVVTWSPFLLLAFCVKSPLAFFRLFFLSHLLLGSIGSYLVARKSRRGELYAFALYSCVMLHPWLMQHLAIGYTPWMNVLLIPLILWAFFTARESRYYWAFIVFASLLSALILYQGGVHVFIWLSMSMSAYVFFQTLLSRNIMLLRDFFVYYVMTLCLSLPKILSTHSEYSGYRQDILKSYQSFSDIWGILTDTESDLYALPQAYDVYNITLYDISCVVGEFWFLGFLLAFVLYAVSFFHMKTSALMRTSLRQSTTYLLIAILFILLGYDGVWTFLTDRLSILSVEKYPARFLHIALLFSTLFLLSQLFESLHLRHGRKVLFLIIIVAISYQNYSRNVYFSNIAISGKTRYQQKDLPSMWSAGLFPQSLHTTSIVRHKINPQRAIFFLKPRNKVRRIYLPNLTAEYLRSFKLSHGKIVDIKTMKRYQEKHQGKYGAVLEIPPNVTEVVLAPML